MKTIYGTIGYILFKHSNKEQYILLLADSHAQLPYCGDSIDISNWFKENMNKLDLKILLEEIPRVDNDLIFEIFPESEHTQKLKNLYLGNPSVIHAIDIRSYLMPYSWEVKNLVSSNETLKEYLVLLEDFFNFKNKQINNYLNYNLNNQLDEHAELKLNFNNILHKYNEFKKTYEKYMNEQIIKIDNSILEETSNIRDMIMEFLVISKIYKLNNKNIIIHTGLLHANEIFKLLIKYYSYELKYKSNINYDNGCTNIPNFIFEKFSHIV